MPNEAVMKDFSKTNYSSARAALLEAWRVYLMYRSWFARLYCQPIFQMVMEEAWLRDFITLANGAQDFYAALPLWCNVTWIGPARGYVDPVKEANANILLNQPGLKTRKEILEELQRLETERRRIADHTQVNKTDLRNMVEKN